MPETLTSYDEVPYPSYPFPQTHPTRLGAVASVFGMKPPPLAGCRILELGCASGGNLLPMAVAYPEWRLLGLDASRRQVAAGQGILDELKLPNVELRCQDITAIDERLGTFEYILCHGVYSWVPDAVQDKILDVCARHLAPDGIAYVSYNTYPGWHMHGTIREMMCYHTAAFAGASNRVAQARSLLDFLARSVPADNHPYGMMLRKELAFLERKTDSYLFHEFLEQENEPVYFHQFVERAGAKRLQYLGEADVRLMVAAGLPPEVEGVLRHLATDLVRLQQYLDFLRNTGFRQSLFCHPHVKLDRSRRLDCLKALSVASPARPVSPSPDLVSRTVEEFQCEQGRMATDQPAVKTAMLLLAESWPRPLPFEDLCSAVQARLGATASAQDGQILATSLLNGYVNTSLIELSFYPPRFQTEVSVRPAASLLARLQARTGIPVTSQRHETVELGEGERGFLARLDGATARNSADQAADTLLRRFASCALLVE